VLVFSLLTFDGRLSTAIIKMINGWDFKQAMQRKKPKKQKKSLAAELLIWRDRIKVVVGQNMACPPALCRKYSRSHPHTVMDCAESGARSDPVTSIRGPRLAG
jgi:hypothetical protein